MNPGANYFMHQFIRFNILLLFLMPEYLFAGPVIVMNTAFAPPISNQSQTGFADKVLAEAFSRLGYRLETVQLPAERALINANMGIDDGDLLRVAGLQKKYPNLIQVPEKIMNMDMVLFTKNTNLFNLEGWKSIRGRSIAIISGWKIMEKNFARFGNEIEIIKTDNIEQSFSLLLKNRVDFVAYSRWSGLAYLKKNDVSGVALMQPPLASPSFYPYLNKKHQKIVTKLAAVIRQMKQDGSIQKYYDDILKPLASSAKKNRQ